LHHLLIAVALLSLVGLDLIFVSFSDSSSAALTFAVLSYAILLLLSLSAGTMVPPPQGNGALLVLLPDPGPLEFALRTLLAAAVPVVLLLVLAFMPGQDNPFGPSASVQLGTTFAVFWLLMSLALTGTVLGFLWPRTGAVQAVLAGALVVLVQGLLSWARVDASRETIQLALYTWMVWVSLCLAGAWVGLVLRRISDLYLYQAGTGSEAALADDPDPAYAEPGQP
jgi:hypothetical protein